MGKLVYSIMNSVSFVYFQKIFMVVLFIVLLIIFLKKDNRDERVRAIIGTASIYTLVTFFIGMNILSYFSFVVIKNIVIFTNSICLLFIACEIVDIISIIILKRIR